MKTRMIASALLIIILSAGISSNAGAAPWRHGYCRPHFGVRVVAPRIAIGIPPVVVGGYYPRPYYGGYYAAPVAYGPRYYGYHGYYGGPRYYGHGYYGHGYGRGYRR